MKIVFLNVTQFVNEHEKYLNVHKVYRDISSFSKVIRYLWFKLNLPFKKLWLKKDLSETLRNNNVVILSATEFNVKLVKTISKMTSFNTELILWYWNPINKICNPSTISSRWRQVTFDKIDAETYQMEFNGTYYFKEFCEVYNSLEKKVKGNDVFFIGQDKGRLNGLIKIQEDFNSLGIDLNLHVVKDSTSTNPNFNFKSKLSYVDVLQSIKNSHTLLDFNQCEQNGITLRVMEGLFFKKKVISNNSNLVLYDFYSRENFFILDVDDTSELASFIYSDYKEIDSEILERYYFENWLERLISSDK